MPLQEHHQIVSVDDHLVEHPRVWQDRIPAQFRDEAPRIKEVNGMHLWHYDGTVFPTIGLNAVAGKPREQWGLDPVRYEDMIPGCYDPAARVKDMDLDGEQAALCFPSFPGFGGGTFFRAKDKARSPPCACRRGTTSTSTSGAGPRRTGSSRWRSCRSGTSTCAWPRPSGPSRRARGRSRSRTPPCRWACPRSTPTTGTRSGRCGAETGTRRCRCTSGPVRSCPASSFMAFKLTAKEMTAASGVEDGAVYVIPTILFSSNLMWTTVDLLFSGALQKFPNLTFSLAEGGIGWIPYLLERSDYTWDRHRWYQDIDKESRPSDLFRKHFYGCFIDDEHGLENRHAIGIDRITMEIDFPHSDSNWPNSRKRAAEALANIPDDEVEMIVETNARRMLHFPRTS